MKFTDPENKIPKNPPADAAEWSRKLDSKMLGKIHSVSVFLRVSLVWLIWGVMFHKVEKKKADSLKQAFRSIVIRDTSMLDKTSDDESFHCTTSWGYP